MGRVVIAEATLQKQMCWGGVVGGTWLDLLSHHGWGLSFLPFYRDIFFHKRNEFLSTKLSKLFLFKGLRIEMRSSPRDSAETNLT